MSKVFNDPVHGHIELPELCVRIINTSEFQRLCHIKQLGAADKVYPGASHSRFQHSLGVCFLAGKFIHHLKRIQGKNIDISEKDILCVQVAGLCHDLGHGPLSHVFEKFFIQKLGNEKWKHEKGTCMMFDHLWKTVPREDLEPKLDDKDATFIKELIHKTKVWTAEDRKAKTDRGEEKDFLYQIVANDENGIDVDKWDFFARDSYYLGIKNIFDHNRLIEFSRLNKVETDKDKGWHICYRDKEVEHLYHMFYSRVVLYRRAYIHKTTRAIEIMYMEALSAVNELPSFMIPGENGKKLKISDCITDPVAYTKLTDNIFQDILQRYELQRNHEIERIDEAIRMLQKEEGMKKMKMDPFLLKSIAKVENDNGDEIRNLKVTILLEGIHLKDVHDALRSLIKQNYEKALTELNKATSELKDKNIDKRIETYLQDIEEEIRNTSELAVVSKEVKGISEELRRNNVFEAAKKMKEFGKIASNNDEIQEILNLLQRISYMKAAQILQNIEKRIIYSLINEAIPTTQELRSTPKVKFRDSEIEEKLVEMSKGKLKQGEFFINVVKFSYQGDENPVDNVYFYLKTDPEKPVKIKREQVSSLLPIVYSEQCVRLYRRKQLNDDQMKDYRRVFKDWCIENAMIERKVTDTESI